MAAGEAAQAHALDALTSKVQALSSSYEALQVDLRHVANGQDALKGMPLQQMELAHELSRLRDVVDRSQIDTKKGDDALLIAINNLSAVIKENHIDSTATGRRVTEFGGGIRALKWALGIVAGVMLGLGGTVGTMFASSWNSKLAANTSADLKQEVRTAELERQVMEVRLGLGQRDRERRQQGETP